MSADITNQQDMPPEGSGFLRNCAQFLDQYGIIRAAWGAVDGGSTGFSFNSFVTSTLPPHGLLSPTDILHNWMLSPTGIAVTVLESVALFGYGLFGNYWKEDDKNAFKRQVAISWPYVRDILKGSKNSYRAGRNLLQVRELFSNQRMSPLEVSNMALPIGLALGGISIAVRVWKRYVDSERKAMMKRNAELLAEAQAMVFGGPGSVALTDDDEEEEEKKLVQQGQAAYAWTLEMDRIRTALQSQSPEKRAATLAASFMGGVIDAAYLQMGTLTLAALSPSMLITVTVFSAVLSAAIVIQRVYEEYENQRKLRASEVQVLLTLAAKEAAYLLRELHKNLPHEYDDQKEQAFRSAVEKYQRLKTELDDLTTSGYFGAVLTGIRNGVAANSAMSSGLFLAGSIVMLASATFPPAALIACLATSLGCMAGFILHAVIVHHLHQQSLNTRQPTEACVLVDLSEQHTDAHRANLDTLLDGMDGILKYGDHFYWANQKTRTVTRIKSPPQTVCDEVTAIASVITAGNSLLDDISNIAELHQNRPQKTCPEQKLSDFLQAVKDNEHNVSELKPIECETALLSGLLSDPSPEFLVQDFFEVVRSFCSGFSKGQKLIDNILNPLQTADNNGHYHETPVMFILAMTLAAISPILFALRTIVARFGKSPSKPKPPPLPGWQGHPFGFFSGSGRKSYQPVFTPDNDDTDSASASFSSDGSEDDDIIPDSGQDHYTFSSGDTRDTSGTLQLTQ